MIMRTDFKEDLLNYLEDETNDTFAMAGMTKQEVLADKELIEQLWYCFQKNVEEFDVDPDYAYRDALFEVLNIPIMTEN